MEGKEGCLSKMEGLEYLMDQLHHKTSIRLWLHKIPRQTLRAWYRAVFILRAHFPNLAILFCIKGSNFLQSETPRQKDSFAVDLGDFSLRHSSISEALQISLLRPLRRSYIAFLLLHHPPPWRRNLVALDNNKCDSNSPPKTRRYCSPRVLDLFWSQVVRLTQNFSCCFRHI